MRTHLTACFFFLAVALPACSNTNPVHPSEADRSPFIGNSSSQTTDHSNRYLWGIWQVHIDKDLRSAVVTRNREAEMHLNCVRLLEVTPCKNCLSMENLQLLPDNVIQGDLKLKHPYASGNMKLSGFDVRGIFIGEADYTWPVSGRKMAVGDSVPRLLNPDGYTSLFNPTEFPQTNPPALGYIPGNYAFGGDLTATLNPYVAFKRYQPRRIFLFGETGVRTIQVKFPPGPLEFGYAIDGCWQTFPGACIDPIVDFPPDANCLEAYQISTWAGPGLSLDPGAWSYVYATVYDHQGIDSIVGVTAEIPGVVPGAVALQFYDERADGGLVYRGKVTNQLGAPTGDFPFLVRVIDAESDQNLGQIDAWFPGTFPIREGWVMMWGAETGYSYAHDVELNQAGDILVLGEPAKNADCDPSPGEDIDSERLACLSKFDWGGGFEWVDRWDNVDIWQRGDLAVDSQGNSYVFAVFGATVDFDPGPGVEERSSYYDETTGYYKESMFLLKLDQDGGFIWVLTWADDAEIRPRGLATDKDSSSVYLVGSFGGTMDFDPSDGLDERTSIGNDYAPNAFLLKVDSNGAYKWTDTWGGEYYTHANDVTVDGSGDVILSGLFDGTVDFDPGPGEDIHVCEIWSACYFSKFDADGNFQWARDLSAGSPGSPEYSPVVAVDSADNIYLAHEFQLVVDFDPGTEMDVRTSNGSSDAFLTKYDPNGNYLWVLTWGGEYDEDTDFMTIDAFDNIYTGGRYGHTVDFDPGPGVDEHTTKVHAGFLSKFTSDGVFQWVATWEMQMGHTIASDKIGNIYLGASYYCWYEWVDFDPGPTTQFPDCELPINTAEALILKMPYDFYWW